MQTVGIIAEYNPFHNGHQWQLEAAKKQSGCPFSIAVMSGNFVQRGEPAFFDKWKRAEMAVRGGVDLIIELPAVFALRSAQYFAAGGIRLLHSLGIISHVCFGAEHADLILLKKAAGATDDLQILADMHTRLQAGSAYAAALGYALEKNYHISSDMISSPNNILAIEYLRAIEKFSPSLTPIAVKRQQSQYNDLTMMAPFASATAIRNALLHNSSLTDEICSALPATTLEIIKDLFATKRGPVTMSDFSSILLAQLRTSSLKKLEQLPTVSEGLHYKIRESALSAANVTQLLTLLKSKRYPYTRLQRIMIHSLLGTNQSQLALFDEAGPLYARVLAFNKNGRLLLKEMNKHSTIPIITKMTPFLTSKERDLPDLTSLQTMLSLDTIASDIYTLGMPSSNWSQGAWDFRHSPLYLP